MMPRPRSPARPCRAASLCAVATGALAACTPAPEQHAFVERLGTDTTAVEVFTRFPDSIVGEVVSRSPSTRRMQYVMHLDPRGAVSRLEVDWTTPASDPRAAGGERMVVVIAGDTARVETTGGEGSGAGSVAVTAGVIPTDGRLPLPMVLWQLGVDRARAAGMDSVLLSVLRGGRTLDPVPLVRRGEAHWELTVLGYPVDGFVDDEGRVQRVSGERSTLKVVVEPVPPASVDLPTLAAEFAARDAAGRGLGVASPTDTVRQVVDSARVEVVYGRPARRGREIWGNLVGWGEIWRTGANAATHLTVERDARIGDLAVPAGTYTLWSTFTPDSARLIINRETGQWGTRYDPRQDLGRVALRMETLPEPVERFTIQVVPEAGGARLVLEWGARRYSAPLRLEEPAAP